MKYFLFISFIASLAIATQTLSPKHLPIHPPRQEPKPMPVMASEQARFIYREFLPNREESFIIQAIKCNPKAKSELWVEQFRTTQKVANGEVNTIHIYARAGDCEQSPISSVWSEIIKIPKNKKLTQVYITLLSNSIKVL